MFSILRWETRLRNFPFQNRSYAIKTPYKVFQDIDLTTQKVTQISSLFPSAPSNIQWEPPSKIELITLRSPKMQEAIVADGCPHYYVGGLPALMQAVRKLQEDSTATVVFVNDGKMPKTVQSGHQGHVHPSEWSAPDCQTLNLFKTFAKGIGLIKEDDPNDLHNYSYLHFPIVWPNVFNQFDEHLRIFGGFFAHRVIHNLTSEKGVSIQDHWLCENIRDSLAFHENLSKEIERVMKQPSFKRGFRVYWSTNTSELAEKKRIWEELKISCEYMSETEILEHTLLKVDAQLPVLKILGDGKFYLNCTDLIISYLEQCYPDRFTYRKANVAEILLDSNTGKPLEVYEIDNHKKGTLTKVSSLFGSLGHNEVFRVDGRKQKRLWQEVPVSGISSLWTCQISKEELKARFGKKDLTDEELIQKAHQLVAAANLSNLHVTTWECHLEKEHIHLLVRATQGANFNSYVAAKEDLYNMRNNIHHYFIGDWELISVGTCTRKTWVSNVPEYYALSKDSGFIHGLSGIGFSFSGAAFNNLIHP